ncbi:2-amino-4-hydroxy-6-hydroxymethyldihydropteridine diphosphokinase [Mucilaginibacter segetis]|uniref:2-amino-4-hydroxy-6-hydroxymethyldihydropteridine pyrophosphokinase n=1 Tax=Mucilaginibacter segetis TaxID=2793071 RepID=A0A934PWM7_9SPHI|nr:2-amino-4-hydroxy-6-hydroxymethyldihydropteridine diphosphokinase [Mucilaginibacter segetis]MBK0380882.1 2-amino-4-hydroxy-6-hydroxymethyldihydropteridine diphosphokinase [Mucilaginibacter segetis]
MINVFLLLGSNLGKRELFLDEAIGHIENRVGKRLNKSAVYETQSWGKTDEPDYLNQVIELQTGLTAGELLKIILDIELEMGRRREIKWGARIIDIDILFYGNDIISSPELTIPHPELHKRRFTLEPLNQIASDLVHPVLGKTIFLLKKELKDNLIVKIYNFED